MKAQYLQGGNMSWAALDFPMVPLAKLPTSTGPSLWVTRHRPRIDRIACPWLIRRFLDANAQFLFVAPSEVLGVAERFNATPFDVPNTFWSHRGIDGEYCTFDTMIEEFALQHPPLERLATIVRAADTDRHDLHPVAAGLHAISVGLSRQYKDDLQQLDAGMNLYDALYRWTRDGYEEKHDWPAEVKK